MRFGQCFHEIYFFLHNSVRRAARRQYFDANRKCAFLDFYPIADFEGKKLRIYSKPTQDMGNMLGFNATILPFAEIPQAFATGLIEALFTSPQTGIDIQAWDNTSYFTYAGGLLSKNAIVVNQEAFDALPADVQTALVKAGEAASKRGWEMSKATLEAQMGMLAEKGMTVTDAPEQVTAEMKKIGFEVTQNVGGFGVVCVLKNGKGPTVLVRTDTDALPVKEATGLSFASTRTTTDDLGKTVPTMHACAHDVSMTCWNGVTRVLTKLKQEWKGTLVFIAQPAEERGAGAKAMLADGLFKKFPLPDYCLALHVSADQPAGSAMGIDRRHV